MLVFSLTKHQQMQIKLYIIKSLQFYFKEQFVTQIIECKKCFTSTSNPIKVILLYAEIHQYFKNRFTIKKRAIEQEVKTSQELCSEFIEGVQSNLILDELLAEEDLRHRTVYFLITSHLSLLQKIQSIIQIHWVGLAKPNSDNQRFNFASQFNMTQVSANQSSNYIRELCRIHPDYYCQYQFEVFRTSIQMKYNVFFYLSLLIAIANQLVLNYLLNTININFFAIRISIDNPEFIQKLYDIRQSNLLLYFVIFPIILTLLAQTLIDSYFLKHSNRKENFVSYQNIVLNLILFLTIVLYMTEPQQYHYLFSSDHIFFRYMQFIKTLINDFRWQSYLYLFALFNGILWLKIFLMLRYHRRLGPLLRVIENMTGRLCDFLILFWLIIFIFAGVGMVLLFNLRSQFQQIQSAITLLFSWSLGNFDLTYNPDTSLSIYIFEGVFLLVNMVIMLNLFIAILSDIYTILSKKAVSIYLREIIKLLPLWQRHQSCNALTYRVPPLNILNLIFCCAMNKKKESKFNRLIQVFNFIPALIFGHVYILLINVFYFPIAYIKALQFIFIKNKKFNWICFPINLIVYPIFGVLLILSDFFKFYRVLFKKPRSIQSQDNLKQKREEKKLTLAGLIILFEVLEKNFNKVQTARVKQIVKCVKKKLNIDIGFNFIRDIVIQEQEKRLQAGVKIGGKTRVDKQSSYLDEKAQTQRLTLYNSIKSFVFQNSKTQKLINRQYYVDVVVFKNILQEVVLNSMAQRKWSSEDWIKSKGKNQIYPDQLKELDIYDVSTTGAGFGIATTDRMRSLDIVSRGDFAVIRDKINRLKLGTFQKAEKQFRRLRALPKKLVG